MKPMNFPGRKETRRRGALDRLKQERSGRTEIHMASPISASRTAGLDVAIERLERKLNPLSQSTSEADSAEWDKARPLQPLS